MSGTKITTAQVYPKINFSGDKSIIFTPADKEDDIATWEKIIKYYGSDLTNTDLSSNILELKEKKRASNATANTFATYYTLSVKYPVTTESGVVNKTVQPSFVAKNLVSSNGRKRPQHAASLKEYDDYNFLITENNNMTQYGKQFFYVMRHISLTFYHFISESLSKPPSIPCNTHKKENQTVWVALDSPSVFMQTTMFAPNRGTFNPNNKFAFGELNEVDGKKVLRFKPVTYNQNSNLEAARSKFIANIAPKDSTIFKCSIGFTIMCGATGASVSAVMKDTQFITNQNSTSSFEDEIELDDGMNMDDLISKMKVVDREKPEAVEEPEEPEKIEVGKMSTDEASAIADLLGN